MCAYNSTMLSSLTLNSKIIIQSNYHVIGYSIYSPLQPLNAIHWVMAGVLEAVSQSKRRVMCQTRSQSHHRHLHIHTSASAASARLSLRLMTRVNDSPEQSFTRNKHKRQLMQQRLFLRAGAQPQCQRHPGFLNGG